MTSRAFFNETARLAEKFRQAGRVEEAIALYRQTIDQFPDDPIARNGLAETLREAGRVEEAIALFERDISQSPNDPVGPIAKAATLKDWRLYR